MFALDQFIHHVYQHPTALTKSVNAASFYYNKEDELPPNDIHEYLLDGELYSSIFLPCREETKARLSYIEGFSLSKNKEAFFVRRSNNLTYLLSFTYEGQGLLEYDNQRILLKKGTGFLINCRQPHYYRTVQASWAHFDLHINGYYAQQIFEYLRSIRKYQFSQPVDGNFQHQLEKLVNLYNDMSPLRDLFVAAQLDQLLTIMVKDIYEDHSEGQKLPDNFSYLLRYINNNYMNDLSLDFLSDFSHISKSQLNRLFHAYLNCSPTEYIIRLRLNNAMTLLKETTLPASKICVMVGIENENYFRHLFKSRTGMTPKEYRRRQRA